MNEKAVIAKVEALVATLERRKNLYAGSDDDSEMGMSAAYSIAARLLRDALHPEPQPGWICDTCGCWNRDDAPCKYDGDAAHLADREELGT